MPLTVPVTEKGSSFQNTCLLASLIIHRVNRPDHCSCPLSWPSNHHGLHCCTRTYLQTGAMLRSDTTTICYLRRHRLAETHGTVKPMHTLVLRLVLVTGRGLVQEIGQQATIMRSDTQCQTRARLARNSTVHNLRHEARRSEHHTSRITARR